MFHVEHAELLKRAFNQGGIAVPPGTVELFIEYHNTLLEWNKKINLISRRDEGRIFTRHFLESVGLLKIVDFPLGTRVVDLGSGAGFPGIPMRLVRPDLCLILVESKSKRILFLRRIVEDLGLKEVEIVSGRIEEFRDQIEPVDFVVCRSVSDLTTLMKWSQYCLKCPGGKLIAIKGSGVVKELRKLGEKASVLGVKAWRSLKYNPFPSIFQLRESYVIVVEKG